MSEELVPLKLAGHDEALLGIADAWDTSGCVYSRFIYSGDLILRKLMVEDGMDMGGAMKFISLNIERAYVGPTTPIIVWETHGEEE